MHQGDDSISMRRVAGLALSALCIFLFAAFPAAAAATGGIAGMVTGAVSEDPVESVEVCAYQVGGADFGCEDTDSTGEYAILGLDAGSYRVSFEPPFGSEYVSQYYAGKASFEGADPVIVVDGETTPDIDAALEEGGQISGNVTAADTEAPVESSTVCAWLGFSASAGCASTDSTGGYTITGLSPGTYRVSFSPPFGSNYLFQYYDGISSFDGIASYGEADQVEVGAGEETTEIDGALEPGATISGRVTSTVDGEGIQLASVSLYRADSGDYVTSISTDADGDYAVTGLPVGSYKISFTGPFDVSYIPQYYNGKQGIATADPVTISSFGEEITEIDAALEPGATISGQVTSSAGGGPVEFASVCAYESGSGDYVTCTSASSTGGYALTGLRTGSYKIAFNPPFGGNYLSQYYNGKPSFMAADPVTIETAGEDLSGVDAVLEPGGTISGRVTAAGTGDPLESAYVCARKVSGGFSYCASSNFEGEYSIPSLTSGSYIVEFNSPYGDNYLRQYYNGERFQVAADPVEVEVGETTLDIDAALEPGGQIAGIVTGADSEGPIEGVTVCAESVNSSVSFGCGYTDADGEYTISGLWTGSYRVRFSAEEGDLNYLRQYYEGKSSFEDANPVEVVQGSVTEEIDAALAPGGQVTGRVSDALSEAPIEEVWVCASKITTQGGEGSGNCAETDADGEYIISGLSTGDYRISFVAPNNLNYVLQYYEGRDLYAEADPVEVTEGDVTEGVDAELREGGQITGLVKDAVTDQPVAGASVCAYLEGEFEAPVCATAGSDGRYMIRGLATGSYEVRFDPGYVCVGPEGCSTQNYLFQYYDGKSSREEASPIQVEEGSVVEDVDAEMEPGGRIAGTVAAAGSGEKLAGVSVCASPLSGDEEEEFFRCGSTNEAGEYVITGLQTGDYRVSFSAYSLNYLSEYYNGKTAATADPVSVVQGVDTDGVDADLEPGGQVSGMVTVAPSGEPFAGASVCVYKPEAEEVERCTETDSSGTYSIRGLATGSYQVEFSPGYSCAGGACTQLNYVRQFYSGKSTRSEADPVSVVAGSSEDGIDAELQPGGRISGNVTDALSDDPVAGVWICAYPAAGGDAQSCTESNAGGNYMIGGLPGGSHKVEFAPGEVCSPDDCVEMDYAVQYYDGKPSLAAADPVSVTVGATHGSIDVAMTAELGDAPVNTVPPQLTGTPAVGETLSCSQGSWDNSPTEYDFAWRRGASQIAGEEGSAYVVTLADRGFNVTCEVTAGNGSGSATATSNALAVPAPPGAPVNTVPPQLTGTPAVGETLSCSQGSWDNSPTEYDFAWRRGAAAISGEGDATYMVQGADAGQAIACEVTATNGSGSGSAVSNALNVPQPKPANTTPPQLTGTPAVGQALSCSQGAWTNSPTGYDFAWRRDGSPIPGQSSATYVVQGADRGHAITCEVTATNGGGSTVATSNPLSVPAPPGPDPDPAPSDPTPAPSPTPGPTPPGPGLATAPRIATVQGGGAMVKLQCADAGGCRGIVKLVAKSGKKRPSTVVIGKVSFSISPGQAKVLRIKLNGTGKALMRKAGGAGLKVQLTGTGIKKRPLVLKPEPGGKRKSKRLALQGAPGG